MLSSTIGRHGEIALPDEVRERYGFAPNTPIRIIETSTGILIVPMTDEPMSQQLEQELAAWQSVSAESWEMFSYSDDNE
ncbi:MAG: AbrB/MazE/SpoVT family DNA-binding domain-containing protein [Anaerolineae bacterium]